MKVNPKIDLVFKKIFGTEENKDLLMSLINSIVPQDEQIVDLTLKNPYNEANFISDKLSVLILKPPITRNVGMILKFKSRNRNFTYNELYFISQNCMPIN